MSSTAQIDLGTMFQAMTRLYKPETEIPYHIDCLLDQVDRYKPAMQKVAEEATSKGVITPDSMNEVFSDEVLGDPEQIVQKFLAIQTLATRFGALIHAEGWPAREVPKEVVPEAEKAPEPLEEAKPEDKGLPELTRETLIAVLKEKDWAIGQTTSYFGVSRATIRGRIKRFKITDEDVGKRRKTWNRKKVDVPLDVLLEALRKHPTSRVAAGKEIAKRIGRDKPLSTTAVENRIREYEINRNWDGLKWVYSSKKETEDREKSDTTEKGEESE